MAVAILKNPINKITIKSRAKALTTKCSFMPAERISIFVKNIPNGGAPVITKKPTRKNMLVNGSAFKAPRILVILVELYRKNIVPADKKSADLIRE